MTDAEMLGILIAILVPLIFYLLTKYDFIKLERKICKKLDDINPQQPDEITKKKFKKYEKECIPKLKIPETITPEQKIEISGKRERAIEKLDSKVVEFIKANKENLISQEIFLVLGNANYYKGNL